MSDAGRVVPSGAIRWHVRGGGRGPAVLLVHGTGASGHSFLPLAGELERRFELIAPDLPGHAFTTAPRRFVPSVGEIAAALGELVANLGVEPVIAIGHSAGAAIVTRMILDGLVRPKLAVGIGAALMPLRGLTKAVYGNAARALSLASRVVSIPVPDIDGLVRRTGSRLDGAALAGYRRLASRPDHVSGVLSMMANWEIEPLFRELPRVGVPYLFVAGAKDGAVPLVDQRIAAARVAHGRLVVVDDAGHLVHEEQPAKVADAIVHAFEGASS